jgi:hypothetical protein
VQLDCDDISADLAQRFAGQKAPFGDTFGDTSAPERTEATTEHPVLPRKQAEGTGLDRAIFRSSLRTLRLRQKSLSCNNLHIAGWWRLLLVV